MQILLIKDSLLDKSKNALSTKRFIEYITKNQIDALCIANGDDSSMGLIDSFKKKYQKKVKMVVNSGISILVYSKSYEICEDGIYIDNDKVLAVDDAIALISIANDDSYAVQYIPLDLFPEFTEENVKQAHKDPLEVFKKLSKNGQPIVIPLQEFIDIIEENVDEDLKERIRKAKQEINAKTKS